MKTNLNDVISESIKKVLKEYYSESNADLVEPVLKEIYRLGEYCQDNGLYDIAEDLNEVYINAKRNYNIK